MKIQSGVTFAGQIYVKRHGRTEDEGPEGFRHFLKSFAPDAKGSFEALWPAIQQSKFDVIVEHWGTSGLEGAMSECTVSVTSAEPTPKTIVLGSTLEDSYQAVRELLSPRWGVRLTSIFKGKSPFVKKDAPVWKKLRQTLL